MLLLVNFLTDLIEDLRDNLPLMDRARLNVLDVLLDLNCERLEVCLLIVQSVHAREELRFLLLSPCVNGHHFMSLMVLFEDALDAQQLLASLAVGLNALLGVVLALLRL